MCANTYPKRILPHDGWIKEIKADEILKICEEAVIGHRIDGRYENCVSNDLGGTSLNQIALPSNRIPNLSTNLMGAVFQLKDFVFNTKNEGKINWDGYTHTEELIKDSNYEKLTNDMFVVGWRIKDVNNFKFPYKRTFEKKSLYDDFKSEANINDNESLYLKEYENLSISKNKKRYADLEGIVYINHHPSNLNYWHFTIDLYPLPDCETPITNTNNAWRTMMADNVGDYLRRTFIKLDNDPQSFNWEGLVAKK